MGTTGRNARDYVGGWTYESSADPVLSARPGPLDRVLSVHAEQKPRERMVLYALVFGLAPRRCLEIGVRFGGGSRIIAAALRDLAASGHEARLACVDPAPEPDFDWDAELGELATLIREPSPDALGAARDALGGAVDFAFVDGNHDEGPTRADLKGVRAVAADDAVVLCHDAYHEPVRRAIHSVVTRGWYHDCGMVCTTHNPGRFVEPDKPVTYGGVRMLRVRRTSRAGND